ncbi:glycosyltransferase family 9 protein [Candidatus Woesearchaeota archaeon]|nr:glycosyltransferase family 9 protein [Candidatus Woesearchaeota archaeon]
MKILIIKLGAMGDVLRTTSLVPALKEKYPDCSIDWVTKNNAVDLIKNNPNINKIFPIEDLNSLEEHYNLVINFDDEVAACDLASNIKRDKLVGAYVEHGKRKYTEDSAEWFDMGLISKFGKDKADELKAKNDRTYHDIHFDIFGLKNSMKHQTELFLDESSLKFAESFAKKNNISKDEIVIGFNTGAGGRWKDKKLSVEDTIELIKKIGKLQNSKIILFGGPEEEERNQEIISKSQGIVDAGCKNSLPDFAALINLCNVLVTSDSLAMHLGIALKKKVVAFFYPTSAAEIELYGMGEKIIGEGRSYCSYQSECEDPPRWDIDKIINSVKSLI